MLEAQIQNPELNVASRIQTRKLGTVNSDFLLGTDNPRDDFQHPLNGPCIMLYLPHGGAPIELWNIATVTLGRVDRFYKIQPMIERPIITQAY